jgi:repressor LexA
MTTPNPTLTPRQQEVYDLIKSHIEEKGWPPTIREIGGSVGIRSPNGVICHLKALVKKGMIETEDNMSRCIRLVGYRLKHVEE